jgi:transmembrane protein TMEM260 (protein O-mannosyltransferase)
MDYGTPAAIIEALQSPSSSWRSSWPVVWIDRSWFVGLCALVVYAVLAPSHIVDADNAEFATLGALGGGAHPSGYPLYVLWLRAWSWLPGATPAHTTALATAILGGLTVAVLHAACGAWGARPAAATISVAIIAAAPIALQYHSEAEVFALNNLIAGLVVWLAANDGPLRGRWRGAALGLVAGLGLAHHLTCVVLAPIGILGVVRAVRESRASTVALAVLGVAIGVLPYGYLLVADGPASWGTVHGASGLIATILRREYGSFALTSGAIRVPWTDSVAACLATLARSWLWLPALAGVAMLGVRIRRPLGETRWAWAALAASFVLAGPVLCAQFNIPPRGIGLDIVRRFHILPAVLLAIPVAAAWDPLVVRLARPRAVAGFALLGFAALVVAGLPGLVRVHSPAMERGGENLVRSLPAGAVVVVVSEDECFGVRYLLFARGERPDVALVCSELLRRDWYRAQLAQRGLVLPAESSAALGEALLATARPVFIDRGMTGVLAALPSYPLGVVARVLPRGAAVPTASEVAAINRELFQRFDLDYPRPGRDDGFAAVAHRRYAATWAAISELLGAAGDPEAAHDALEVARSLQPLQN